jgi:hypothetical protein
MNAFEETAKQFHRQVISPRKKATDVAIEDKSLLEWAKEEEKEKEHSKDEGPLTVEQRGHLGGLKGGPERDRVLSKKEKTEIAIKGGHARWGEGGESERKK